MRNKSHCILYSKRW